MLQKQRSHDKRQSTTRFYFVAESLNASFSVSASWQSRRYRSVCIGRRAYASESLTTRHLTRSRRQRELTLTLHNRTTDLFDTQTRFAILLAKNVSFFSRENSSHAGRVNRSFGYRNTTLCCKKTR